ncbi:hypothetical protein NKZ03_17640 [Sinorhizobium meliloti]|uniref:hypothetical protein n=1 Tax=Rhizobium meliloti TaxID=382 RepID=UPI003D65A9FD
MTAEEFSALYLIATTGLNDTGWHWFSYHFYVGPTPFASSILSSCASIDRRATGIGTDLLRELVAIGGRERDERQYEQLLQKLSEILVIERVVNCPWPEETTFQHEPAAVPGGPRPELLISYPEGRLVVEVKTPALLEHIRARATNGIQLAYRGGVPLELAEELGEDAVTLPRDNPVLDFLRDGERKFVGFRQDPGTASLLVIVWDDFIYEPISALVNERSGLLTRNSFARAPNGTPQTYPNVDAVIAIRHLNYLIAGSREEILGDRLTAMDFGDGCALPNVLFDVEGARPIPTFVLDALRAFRHDDPGLRMFAEYNPQDMVFWL